MTNNLYERIFFGGLIFTYILITVTILGLGGEKSREHLSNLNYFMKIYVCVLILVRFNPLVDTHFTKFDKRLVFTSALFLLSTTTIEEIIAYVTKANPFILKR
jgi:hypothetical protein